MKYLLAMMLLTSSVHADDTETLHFAAHFGMSYAINTMVFGIAKKAFKMDSFDAWVFSATTTLLIGLSYKWMADSRSSTFNQDLGNAMLYNTLGVTTFGLTVKAFDF